MQPHWNENAPEEEYVEKVEQPINVKDYHSITDGVRVFKTRWYILSLYCLTAILQNVMWNTWGPIQATARAVYDWDDYVIDLMAAWGCITFSIAMIPFSWLMDVKGG